MSDILPCKARDENKTACETLPFPGNETCVFEFGVCNSVKEDPETGQHVYEVTIPADLKTIPDKSTFLQSSIVNGVCGNAVLGLLESAKLDGVAILPAADADPVTAAPPATAADADTGRTIEVKDLPKRPVECPKSPTCPEKPMTKEQLAILLSLFAQIKTLNPSFKPLTDKELAQIKKSNASGEISWYQYILEELKKNGSQTNPGDEKVKYTVMFVDDSESTGDSLAESIIEKIAGCSDGAGGGKRKRSRRGKKQKKSKRSTRKKRKRKSKKNNIGIN